MPMSFIVCRLMLERVLDRRNVAALKGKLELMQSQLLGRYGSMDEAKDAAKVYSETKETLKAEQASVKSLQRSYEEALALVDEELKKNRTLRRELDKIDEENKVLKTDLHSSNKNKDRSLSIFGGSSSEDLQKKIKVLETKKKDLENLLRSERANIGALKASEREALALRDAEARQNRIIKKEMERLQEDNKKMKGYQYEVTEMNLDISNKDEIIERLEKESLEKQAKVEELETNRKDLMSMIDSEKERSTSLDGEVKEQRNKSHGLEQDLQAEREHGVEKDKLYSICEETLAEEQAKTASLEGLKCQLTEELEAERSTVAQQQETISEKDDWIATLKAFEAEMQTLTDTPQPKDVTQEATKTMLTSMTNTLTQIKEDNKQIPELKTQVQCLEQALAEKEAALSTESARAETLNQKYEATKLTLSSAFEERTAVEQKFAALEKEFDQVSDAKQLLVYQKEACAKLHTENSELNSILTVAKASNLNLQSSLDDKTKLVEANEAMLTDANAKVASLEKETSEMKQQITDLTASLDGATEDSKNVAEIESERDAEKEKNAKLKKDINELNTNFDEVNEKVRRLEKTLKRREVTIKDDEVAISSLEASNRELKEENKSLQDVDAEVSRLNNYLGSMKLTVDELKDSLESRDSQIKVLNQKYAKLEEEKEEVIAEKKILQAEEQKMKQNLASVDKDLQAESNKLKSLTKENEELKETDIRTEEIIKKLQSTLEKKETVLVRKEEDIARLQNQLASAEVTVSKVSSASDERFNDLAAQNLSLQKSQEEVYHKMEDLTFSSQKMIKDLESSLESKEKSIGEQQGKIQSLIKQLEAKDSQKNEATRAVADRMDEEFKGIKKQLHETKAGYEAEKLKVINLEALKKTSQKMIRDLETILDKKEIILSKKQEEIAEMKQGLEQSTEAFEAQRMKTSSLEEKIKKGDYSTEVAKLKVLTESQSEYFDELKKRETSMKRNLADANQKLKLRDMLLVSGAFHAAETPTNRSPMVSPSGAPTPEGNNSWGSRR